MGLATRCCVQIGASEPSRRQTPGRKTTSSALPPQSRSARLRPNGCVETPAATAATAGHCHAVHDSSPHAPNRRRPPPARARASLVHHSPHGCAPPGPRTELVSRPTFATMRLLARAARWGAGRGDRNTPSPTTSKRWRRPRCSRPGQIRNRSWSPRSQRLPRVILGLGL